MNILNQLTIILLLSTFFAALFKYLKQPIFLAYVSVGILVGSYILPDFELTSNNQYFELIISILLFISGLSINLRFLKDLGESILLKNIFTFLVLGIVFYFTLTFLGFDILESVILSLCLGFSSSIIFNKVTTDDYLHRSLFNKIAASHLLIQTFFLIIALVFLNSFSIGKNLGNFYDLILNNLVKTLILIVNLYLVSRYIISRLEKFISESKEFLFIFVIGFGFGVVSLFKFLNLSYELGAIVAGVLLAMHPFSLDLTDRLKVVREVSLLGFFILLGAGVDFEILSSKFLLIFILFLLVGLFKTVIYLATEKFFNTPLRENFFNSIALISISEFSLIIVLISIANGLLNQEIFSVIGFLYILLALINIYFLKHREFLFHKYNEALTIFKPYLSKLEKSKDVDVILLGGGKLGFYFLDTYKYLKSKLLVVDYDSEVIKKLDKLKINNLSGDLQDSEFFDSLPYLNSKLIYLSINNRELIIKFLNKLKFKKYSGIKIVVSYNHDDTLEFYRLGADYVIMPDYIPGKFVSDLTLNLGFEPKKYLSEKALHLESLKTKENHKF